MRKELQIMKELNQLPPSWGIFFHRGDRKYLPVMDMFVGIRVHLPVLRNDVYETQDSLNRKDPVLSLWAKQSPTYSVRS